MGELPDSWSAVPLAEVVNFNPGIDKTKFRDEDEVPFVPMPAVEAETGRIDTSAWRPFGEVKSGFTAFASGDVLFAKITPCMENGKMAVAPMLPHGVGFGTTEFHVLRPTAAVTAEWVYYFVSSAAVRHEAQHHMTGAVGQKRVPKRYLETKEFPLPPLNEQRRIVDKIETLFARLDQGEAALRQVQKLLARYRQSVLKAAVTGELTSDWRAENVHRLEHGRDLLARILQTRRETWQGRGPYKEPAASDTTGLPELPEGWVWASVDQLSCNHDGKRIPLKRSEREKRSGAYPYYGAQGIIDDIDDYLFDGSYLLVAEDGANLLSRVKPLAFQANGKFWVNNHAHILEIIPGAALDFIELAINSLDISRSVTGTAQPKLTQAALNRLIVPLPGDLEQSKICDLVQEAFTRAERVVAWCQTELTRSAALRQSILKDAFAGKLVPQDPADEPAAELLARIRASRAAAPAKPRNKASA